MSNEEDLGIASSLRRTVQLLPELEGRALDPQKVFMNSVVEAIDHLEMSIACSLALQREAARREDRIAYSMREVAELVPVPYGRCLQAAQNHALVAHREGTRGRWVVSREAVISWVSEGCPKHLRHPGGIAPGSPHYRRWMERRAQL